MEAEGGGRRDNAEVAYLHKCILDLHTLMFSIQTELIQSDLHTNKTRHTSIHACPATREVLFLLCTWESDAGDMHIHK